MSYSDFIDGADLAEAQFHFLIQNYDKYISISIGATDRPIVVRHFKSQDEMARAVYNSLTRKTSVFYFKKSDYDRFIRTGNNLAQHLHKTGRNKEVAQRIKEEYFK